MSEPKFGDRVRVRCGATGRYLGDGLALVISAMDNELFLDLVKDDGPPPHPSLPVPGDEALLAAEAGLRLQRAALERRAKAVTE